VTFSLMKSELFSPSQVGGKSPSKNFQTEGFYYPAEYFVRRITIYTFCCYILIIRTDGFSRK
jgi:hypothetical protein